MTSKPLKHIISVTVPKAQHDFECVWCKKRIDKGRVHVRCVWEGNDDMFHSDHYHVECWEEMSHD